MQPRNHEEEKTLVLYFVFSWPKAWLITHAATQAI